jgi:uncharacterized protein YnzC (UPF0291/DUF896 family)
VATAQSIAGGTEAAILGRMIHPEKADLPAGAAQALLRLQFDQADLDRMHELAVKNQDDALTPVEKAELEAYLRISYFIDLMRAKARCSIENPKLVAIRDILMAGGLF